MFPVFANLFSRHPVHPGYDFLDSFFFRLACCLPASMCRHSSLSSRVAQQQSEQSTRCTRASSAEYWYDTPLISTRFPLHPPCFPSSCQSSIGSVPPNQTKDLYIRGRTPSKAAKLPQDDQDAGECAHLASIDTHSSVYKENGNKKDGVVAKAPSQSHNHSPTRDVGVLVESVNTSRHGSLHTSSHGSIS